MYSSSRFFSHGNKTRATTELYLVDVIRRLLIHKVSL